MDLGYMSKIEFAGYYGAAKNKLSMVEDYPQDYKAKNLAGGFVSFSVAKNLELWGSYFKTRLEYKDDTFNQSINDIDALNGMIPGTSAIADRYRIDQTYSEMGSLGMSYKGKGYWFDAEYALSDVKSGYAAIGLDMGSFRPYVMYSDMVTKKPTPDNVIPTGVSPLLDIASASADYLQSVAQTHQYGAAIGFKYNLNKNIDLKAQYEYVRVPEGRGLVYTANTDKAFNNIGAGVDFKF